MDTNTPYLFGNQKCNNITLSRATTKFFKPCRIFETKWLDKKNDGIKVRSVTIQKEQLFLIGLKEK